MEMLFWNKSLKRFEVKQKNDPTAVCGYIAEVRNNLIETSSLGIVGKSIKSAGTNSKTAGYSYKTAG
nr:hypothetical protein [uncultured Acetobacteroides sp.]